MGKPLEHDDPTPFATLRQVGQAVVERIEIGAVPLRKREGPSDGLQHDFLSTQSEQSTSTKR